jgi:hypothetical protein
MAPMIGCSTSSMSAMSRLACTNDRPACRSRSNAPVWAAALFMSAPAQNARPAPVMMIAPTDASSATSCQNSSSWLCACLVMAFSAAGRFSVRVTSRSSRSTRNAS